MPRSIDYRATSAHPADRVYATMVDRDVLQARLNELGGTEAEILEFDPTPDGGVAYTLRHGISSEELPEVVTKFLPGGKLVIKRTERWAPAEGGGYAGSGRVAITSTPANAKATMSLRDTDSGSELVVTVEVTVKVPLIGAKVEESVGEQIRNLLEMETGFTLARIPS